MRTCVCVCVYLFSTSHPQQRCYLIILSCYRLNFRFFQRYRITDKQCLISILSFSISCRQRRDVVRQVEVAADTSLVERQDEARRDGGE